ncbi:MAG: hypothetical protein ABIH56_01440 [Candidatus Margulisiibacteriota bacterium]
MKKTLIYSLLVMTLFFLPSCSFFADKPSDSQIKKDVEAYFAGTYKPLQINKTYVKGILFRKDGRVMGKVAIALVRVEAEFKRDYNCPKSKSSKFEDLLLLFSVPLGLKNNHKKGEIILFEVKQEYYRSDRAWLPLKIGSGDINVIDENGGRAQK